MSARILIGDCRDILKTLPDQSVHCIDTLAGWQLAYLAGLIDGEGSIESQQERQPKGKTPRFVLRVSFTFATEEPLATISKWIGSTYSVYPPVDNRRSARFRSHIYKATAVKLLRRCLPYLILKRRQAELILEIEAVRARYSTVSEPRPGRIGAQPMPDHAIQQMMAFHAELRALKSNKKGRGQ